MVTTGPSQSTDQEPISFEAPNRYQQGYCLQQHTTINQSTISSYRNMDISVNQYLQKATDQLFTKPSERSDLYMEESQTRRFTRPQNSRVEDLGSTQRRNGPIIRSNSRDNLTDLEVTENFVRSLKRKNMKAKPRTAARPRQLLNESFRDKPSVARETAAKKQIRVIW